MRGLVYDVAVSLDGFIAGVGDDISVFPAHGDHVDACLRRLRSYDAVVRGRRTYEFGYRFGLEPGARAYPHLAHPVLSRTIALPSGAAVGVVRDDFADHVAALERAPGGDVYLCGGGALAGLLANAGLIDRVILKIAPARLGAGVPLFAELARPLRLAPVAEERHASGVRVVSYDVVATEPPSPTARSSPSPSPPAA